MVAMRLTGTCWSCTLLLAGHFVRVWGTGSEENHTLGRPKKADYGNLSLWGRIFTQKRLETQCPVDHQLCPDAVGGGCCPKTRVCGTESCLATMVTDITISPPKITEAPLFKRKLGSNKWDVIHDGIQGRKRDATDCGSGSQLCAASLNGGCCPNDRVCGSDSCYAASAPPAIVCGAAGYVACGLAEGGGCCPQGYACQVGGCSPSAGVSNTESCGLGSYLCPASVGYGCCTNGFACGVNACYATSVTTFIFTETLTTTDAQNIPHTLTSTVTTASTPTLPTDVASNTALGGVIAKVIPSATAIQKTSPTSAAGGSSGMTRAEIGGIIGGAIALLVLLILATFFIIRRLNKVVKVTTASQSQMSNGDRSRHPRYPKPSLSDISIDPLIMTPSEASRSVRFPSHPSVAHSPAHEVDASTQPVFGIPFFPQSPIFTQISRGYNPVPTSDSNSSSGYGRNPSMESTPPLGQNPKVGYFDIPAEPDLRDQNLRFGHSPVLRIPNHHERNYSNSSNQSEVSAGWSSIAELDAGSDGDLRSNLQRALQGFGMGKPSMRRKGSHTNPSPRTLTGGPTSRYADCRPGPSAGAVGLGHIPEAGESRIHLQEAQETEMRDIPLVGHQEYQGIVNTCEPRV